MKLLIAEDEFLCRENLKKMLEAIGAESIEALVRETMPADILLPEPIDLDEPYSEQKMLDIAEKSLADNAPARSYIGRGFNIILNL